ncbi:ethanolamine ammonia-lyase light chain EutC [Blastococcus sp. HT6-30]|uniref:ethanolamine ammonia-lyase light chain EutC n=1 Tax=Blastococcus sp. HT6-30 TaxID=3144843 RepID=UPI00321AB3E0
MLRAATRARVALGRAGDGLPTARELEFRRAQAVARDAVHTALDPGIVRAALDGLPVLEAHSAAADRAQYLQRPDLGRRLAPGWSLPRPEADRPTSPSCWPTASRRGRCTSTGPS